MVGSMRHASALVLVSSLVLGSALGAQDVLFDFGAEWSFFRGSAAPSDPPTDWRTPGFDAALWESGPTGIGYGDDDDATLLEDMQGAYAAVFLRKTFNIASAAAVPSLLLSANYDDGFVAYLNGIEVARSASAGLPGEELAFDAFVASHEGDSLEYFDLSGSLNLLVDGDNLLAVEVHNTSLTSSDLSFNARLTADDPRGDCLTGITCTNNVDSVTLSWTIPDGVVYDQFIVERNGTPLTGSPFSDLTTEVVDATPGDFNNTYTVIARIQGVDCDPVTCQTDAMFTLVDDDEEWLFFRGTVAPSDPATDWRDPGFNDAAWETGATGIGYADGDDATELTDMRQIADDPNTPDVDESQPGYLTFYCRKTFSIPDLALITNLQLEIDYDDGFIAYLNGTEIARSANMGAAGQEFAFDQPTEGGGREAGTAEVFAVDASLAIQGDNVLAVEIHNVNITSSDASFIPSLIANECVGGLACDVDDTTGNVTLTWDATPADSISVLRDGEHIAGSPFEGDVTMAVDNAAPDRDVEYEVIATVAGVECPALTCTVTCNARMPEALTCELFLDGGFTQAQLSWTPPAGALTIDVVREGTVIDSLPGDATEYTDVNVESDEPENDTAYAVVFIFSDDSTCTINCGGLSLCPEDLVCEITDVAGTPRVRMSWGNMVKNWDSFTIQRDGADLTIGLPGDTTEYVDEDSNLVPGEPHTYTLVPIAPAGFEVNCNRSCTVALPVPEIGEYLPPNGGWDYRIDFNAGDDAYVATTGVGGNLDGDWIRAIGLDGWDGSTPLDVGAAPGGDAPGGIGIETQTGLGHCEDEDVSSLRILDPGNPAAPAGSLAEEFPDPYDEPANQAFFLARDSGVDDGNLLKSGVTILARWRINPNPPEYMNAQVTGDGEPIVGGIGQIGFYFLNDGSLDPATHGDSAALSLALNSGDNMLISTGDSITAADIDTYRSVWVTVEDSDPNDGLDEYNVAFYMNGDTQPYALFGNATGATLPAATFDVGKAAGNFLGIGLADAGNDGDVQIDYVAYKAGVHTPTSRLCNPPKGTLFIRGDTNGDGGINIADPIFLLNNLFGGGPSSTCREATDINGDGGVNIADPVFQLNGLFGGGPAPGAPHPNCGLDPDPPGLGCASHPCN